MTATETELRERLREVEDPALGSDIVSLGLIDDLRVTDGVAELTLEFTAPYAPDEMAMGRQIREVAADLGLEAQLSVTFPDRDSGSPIPEVRNVIAVSSGKGGVGKTTVATNLAAGLADAGARVGLFDADIYGPNVPRMVGIEAEPGVTDEEKHDPAMLRGPMIDKLIVELLEDVEWNRLDYLVVDLPPGTGDAQLTLLQTVPVAGALIVTTPEDVALDDVRKGLRIFSDHDVPILGLVENMSGFHCPDCGGVHDLFGSGGGSEVAAEYDVPLLAEIPMDPEIRSRNDADGPPAVLGGGPAAEPLSELVDAVTNRVGAVGRAAVSGVDPGEFGLESGDSGLESDEHTADAEGSTVEGAVAESTAAGGFEGADAHEDANSDTGSAVSGGLEFSDGDDGSE